VSSAELTLTPQDLGPVQIAIEVRGQDASLLLQAAHPATRAALEEALPKLREMFADQGLRLADAQVGQQAPHDARGGSQGQSPHGEAARGRVGNPTEPAFVAAPAPRRLDRLIDVVA
jgi:flagellar hook-length control protein FliK